jgi:hypothetical protein
MVITNGTICARVDTGGGLDSAGNPIAPLSVWDDPVPCRIRSNKHSDIGTWNGNAFTVASYVALIEMQPFQASHIKLIREDGKDLGEFPVMQIEPLEAVKAIKIVV